MPVQKTGALLFALLCSVLEEDAAGGQVRLGSGALASTVVAAGGFSYKIYGLCTLLKKLFLLELSAHQVRCMSPSSSG